MLKKLQANFTAGVMVFLVIGIPAYVAFRVWESIGGFAAWLDFRFSKSATLNTAIYAAIFAAAATLVGAIFKFKLFRKAFDLFAEKVPLVSTVARFIPKHDELDIFSDKRIKEVVFLYSRDPHIWARGLVTKTWTNAETGKKWVRVYVGSCPVPFTGYAPFEMEWNDAAIRYTGRTAAEYSALVMSFGIRSDDSKKPAS